MRMLFRGGLALMVGLALTMLQGQAQNPAVMSDDLPTTGIFNDPQWRAWAGKSTAYRMAQQKQVEVDRAAREKDEKENPEKFKVESPKALAESRQKEQNAYFRRVEVCDRLREIATQTNDSGLMKVVEQLDGDVFDLYQRRTGMAGLRQPTGGGSTADENLLDSRVGPKSSETGMILPMPPTSGKKSTTVVTRPEGKR